MIFILFVRFVEVNLLFWFYISNLYRVNMSHVKLAHILAVSHVLQLNNEPHSVLEVEKQVFCFSLAKQNYCRVPVVLQPKCLLQPPAAALNTTKIKRQAGDEDLWAELETAAWGEKVEDDCSPGRQLSGLSLAALARLASLAKMLNEEPFSLDLGMINNVIG